MEGEADPRASDSAKHSVEQSTAPATSLAHNNALRERRKRLSSEQRRLIAEHLNTRGPRRCYVDQCGGQPTLDHIDGNRNNQHIENFRWACARHQKVPTVASKLVSARVSVGGAVDPQDNLVQVHERYQTALTNWLMKKLGPEGPHKYLPIRMIEQEASYDCQISSVTIHRYLVNPGELTASNGPFRLVERIVTGDRPSRSTKCVMWRGHRVLREEVLTD